MVEIFLRKSLLLTTLVFRGDYRVSTSGTTFNEMMQADAFLSLRSVVQQPEGQTRDFWFPRTLLYLDGNRLPLFVKAGGGAIKAGILKALGVADAKEFAARFEKVAAALNNFGNWRMDSELIDLRSATNVAQLSVRPVHGPGLVVGLGAAA